MNSCTTFTLEPSCMPWAIVPRPSPRRGFRTMGLRSGCCQEQVLANAVQTAGIRELRQLYRSHLLRGSLPGLRDGNSTVSSNRDAGGIVRNGDGRLQGIAVGGDQCTLAIEVEIPRAGVAYFSAGKCDLKKA